MEGLGERAGRAPALEETLRHHVREYVRGRDALHHVRDYINSVSALLKSVDLCGMRQCVCVVMSALEAIMSAATLGPKVSIKRESGTSTHMHTRT